MGVEQNFFSASFWKTTQSPASQVHDNEIMMIIKDFQPNSSIMCDTHCEDFWPTNERVSVCLQAWFPHEIKYEWFFFSFLGWFGKSLE